MDRLDKFFTKLVAPSFTRYGFAYGDVLSRWADIVGPELCRFCQPERIRWPRKSEHDSQRHAGGTLFLQVCAGRSLDIQHEAPRILAKINLFYGYPAVAQVKIITVQKASFQSPHLAKMLPEASQATPQLTQKLQSFQDPELRSALLKLGLTVMAGRSSPQTK